MFCNKYKAILLDSFLCEECEDNPKVSTGYYNECKQLTKDIIMTGYVAKDKDGDIYLHEVEPTYNENAGCWFSRLAEFRITGAFPKFDSMSYTDKPIKVEIKLERV
jgi:hypothetical protein